MEEEDTKNRAHMGKRTLTTYRTYGPTVLHFIPCFSLNTYLPHNGHRIHIIKGIISDHNSNLKTKNKSKNIEKYILIQLL